MSPSFVLGAVQYSKAQMTRRKVRASMFGKHFRFGKETISMDKAAGGAVMVPAGDIVLVVREPSPHDDRMVDVLWNRRVVAMFAHHVKLYAREVQV
jgi:hypothetical protein